MSSVLCFFFFFLIADMALRADSIDLHVTDNRVEHHTDEYEHEDLIVRRGQQFRITIYFNRAYNDSQDTIVLQFVTGEKRDIFY